jgi:hypothetical protein
MRFVERDAHRNELRAPWSEIAGHDGGAQTIEHGARQKLGGGILPGEGGLFVQILEGQLAEHTIESLVRSADVDDHAFLAELGATELDVHYVRGAVHLLRGPEELPAKAVRHHHVTANANRVHAVSSIDAHSLLTA